MLYDPDVAAEQDNETSADFVSYIIICSIVVFVALERLLDKFEVVLGAGRDSSAQEIAC